MIFSHSRIIHFADTDAAGVVYFAQVLSLCHEAYESALAGHGINLREFFSCPDWAIPIVHSSVDFYRPLYCGDSIVITGQPRQTSNHSYTISYQIHVQEALAAEGVTKHVCIHPQGRQRQVLPGLISTWLARFS